MSLKPMTRERVREVDRRAVEEFELPSVVLMENAGRGAAELMRRLGIRGEVAICAGKGNNAGDGFVIARHLENFGVAVRVLLFGDPQALQGDAATNFAVLEHAGTPLEVFEDAPEASALGGALRGADWIVDALLGTGTQGEIREPFATVIEAINGTPARALAVDLPSGLDCDTGRELGVCVRADHTATFVAPKAGFAAAARLTGRVHVVGIGVPRALLMQFPQS